MHSNPWQRRAEKQVAERRQQITEVNTKKLPQSTRVFSIQFAQEVTSDVHHLAWEI